MRRLDAYRAWLGLNAVQSFAGALFGIVFAVYFVQVVHMDAVLGDVVARHADPVLAVQDRQLQRAGAVLAYA